MKNSELFYLTSMDGDKTNEGVTVKRLHNEGYTTRLRNNTLVVFHKGTVVVKGYQSNLENILEGSM